MQLQRENPIAAQNQGEGPEDWETSRGYDTQALTSPPATAHDIEYYGKDKLSTGFASCNGASGVGDSLATRKPMGFGRPSSAQVQRTSPIERENSGLGPGEWSTSARSQAISAAISRIESDPSLDPDVMVTYGKNSGQRFRFKSEAVSQIATRPRTSGGGKAREQTNPCPIFDHRVSRGRSDDPWATTSQCAYGSPPTTNDFIATQEFDNTEAARNNRRY